MNAVNPVLVEVTRGSAVESRHRGAVAVVDAQATCLCAIGDTARPVFPRSAVKPLQALVLLESGAAERFAVDDAEVALACASHGATPAHVDVVAAWLARLGVAAGDLACGPHPPLDSAAAAALARRGEAPGRLQNNCSGKHAGFVCAALHLGVPAAGYAAPGHAVQRRVAALLSDLGGCPPGAVAVDGCGVPTFAMPLGAVATAMARLVRPDALAPGRAAAARRAVVVKTGAEGVHAAALAGPGLGIAVKIDDGARRAAEAVMAALLVRFGELDAMARAGLDPWLGATVANAAGEPVGTVRLAVGGLDRIGEPNRAVG